MKKLKLNCYGIVISFCELDRRQASIRSDMKEVKSPENNDFNFAVDALESLILAHFCAGVDVSSAAYLEGIETAYESVGNRESSYEGNSRSLIDELRLADSISIDDDAVRHFTICDGEKEDECLDAGEHIFTFDEIESATKTGMTWFIVRGNEEFQLSCERIIPF